MTDFGELSFPSEGTGPRYRPGARLGRYQLLVPIGSGGMAVVWIARLRGEAGFSKLVAIKTMLPHLVEVVEARRMVLDEARVAARIHHPNVVAIQELGEDQGVPYVVMEWVNGLSLDRLLSSPPPDLGIAARIVADACAGLHAAHELVDDTGRSLQVVHRDISPYNVLVSADGAVKVADFGIVKARGQLHRTTALGDVRGRISYMAPEQVMAEPVDRRADVFAMGATLHEVLTGDPAFPGENDAQVIFKIAQTAYEPPERATASARDLFAIAARALSRLPEDRFKSAEEMRLALEAWLAKNAPPVVTSSSIATVVRTRLGPELDQRQIKLRKALNANLDASTRPTITLQGVGYDDALDDDGNPIAQRSQDTGDAAVLRESAPPDSVRIHDSVRSPESARSGDSALAMATSQGSPGEVALPLSIRPTVRGPGARWMMAAAAVAIGIGAWARHRVVMRAGTHIAVEVPAASAAAGAPAPSEEHPGKVESPALTASRSLVPPVEAGAPIDSVHVPEATSPSLRRLVPASSPPPAPPKSGHRPSLPSDDVIPTNPY